MTAVYFKLIDNIMKAVVIILLETITVIIIAGIINNIVNIVIFLESWHTYKYSKHMVIK